MIPVTECAIIEIEQQYAQSLNEDEQTDLQKAREITACDCSTADWHIPVSKIFVEKLSAQQFDQEENLDEIQTTAARH